MFKQTKALPSFFLLMSLSLGASNGYGSTILTFATTGGTGVTVASGAPVLDRNPNVAGGILRSGGADTANYGSNVSASSANNGAFVVSGTATPTVSLVWSLSGMTALEGISSGVAGWTNSNNGVIQLDGLNATNSFSVVFSNSDTSQQMTLNSFDFYRAANSVAANQGRALTVGVTGNMGTTYSSEVAISSAAQGTANFLFDGGVTGLVGETLTLTLTRPDATTELALIQTLLGANFTVQTSSNNQWGFDNLSFSSAAPVSEPTTFGLLSLGVAALLFKRRKNRV